MSKKNSKVTEQSVANSKMIMIEKAMHGEKAGIRESKNYRGKSCDCKKK